MYNVVEYSYDDEKHHLNDKEALEAYTKAKKLHPGAIVVLDDLACGHWDVDIYETPEQKNAYYTKAIVRKLKQWRDKAIRK